MQFGIEFFRTTRSGDTSAPQEFIPYDQYERVIVIAMIKLLEEIAAEINQSQEYTTVLASDFEFHPKSSDRQFNFVFWEKYGSYSELKNRQRQHRGDFETPADVNNELSVIVRGLLFAQNKEKATLRLQPTLEAAGGVVSTLSQEQLSQIAQNLENKTVTVSPLISVKVSFLGQQADSKKIIPFPKLDQ